MCILLVEDEAMIRDVARFILEDAGYEVLEAEHGQAACDHLDQHPGRFTCLVTDYHMPGDLHGGHVVAHTRPLYPTIPIILASAYPHVTSPGWRDAHKVELLVKPYRLSELVAIVQRCLAPKH